MSSDEAYYSVSTLTVKPENIDKVRKIREQWGKHTGRD